MSSTRSLPLQQAPANAISPKDARRLLVAFKHAKNDQIRGVLAELAFKAASKDTSIYSGLPLSAVKEASEKIVLVNSPVRGLAYVARCEEREQPHSINWALHVPGRIGPSLLKKALYVAGHALNLMILPMAYYTAFIRETAAWAGEAAALPIGLLAAFGIYCRTMTSSWKKETQAGLSNLADAIETAVGEALRFQSRSAMEKQKSEYLS